MLKTSRQLALTLDFGKSSTTVDKTVSPQRATLGDPGKKRSTNLLPKNIKNATKKAVIQTTERLSKLQPTRNNLTLALILKLRSGTRGKLYSILLFRYPTQTLHPLYSNTGLNARNNGASCRVMIQLYLYSIEA